MKKKNLARKLAKRTGEETATIEAIFDELIDVLIEEFNKNDTQTVVIPDFMILEKKIRLERYYRNPNFDEPIYCPPKQYVHIKTTGRLRNSLNKEIM